AARSGTTGVTRFAWLLVSRRISGVVGSMPEGSARGRLVVTVEFGVSARGAGAATGVGGLAAAGVEAEACVGVGPAGASTTSMTGDSEGGGAFWATTSLLGAAGGAWTTTGENGLIELR